MTEASIVRPPKGLRRSIGTTGDLPVGREAIISRPLIAGVLFRAPPLPVENTADTLFSAPPSDPTSTATAFMATT